MRVQVVIPGFKAPEKLEKCVNALMEQTFKDFGWIVVDDSETQRGFTKTVNIGIRDRLLARPDFFLVLNQDAYLEPDALERMVGFMDNNPRCGMSSVKQISEKNPDQIVHGGVGPAFPSGVHKVGLVSREDYNKPTREPWAQGACFIVRTEVILEIGLMDENMRMIFSDSDWSYAARSRGWEVWYNPGAVCVHEQGISKSPAPDMMGIFTRDMLHFKSKWVDGDLFNELAQEAL